MTSEQHTRSKLEALSPPDLSMTSSSVVCS